MNVPIVANSNISIPCTVHFVALVFWSFVLLPAGAALDSPRLLLLAALYAFVGLVVWWASPPPSLSAANTNIDTSILAIPMWLAHCLPETAFVGVMITCIFARVCSPPCPSPQSMCSKTTKWISILFAAIVFPLIALNHMSGSCGGKIVTSYKKGYEVFSEMSDDLCSAHFSYLTLSGTALLAGGSWHFVAESSWWSTTVVRGLENIVLCVAGLVLVIFRAATIATFVVNGDGAGVGTGGDTFFANAGKLKDGIIWGNMMGAAICWIVLGFVGVCCVLIDRCRWFASLSVIVSLMALGTALMVTGASTTNTYFGTKDLHHDAVLGVMQSTCLLTAGLLTWSVAVVRAATACLEKLGAGSGVLYYAHSVCGIAATSIGGFVLAAQPAMTQMLSRDLNITCWGVSTIVLTSAILIHMVWRGVVSATSQRKSKQEKRPAGQQ